MSRKTCSKRVSAREKQRRVKWCNGGDVDQRKGTDYVPKPCAEMLGNVRDYVTKQVVFALTFDRDWVHSRQDIADFAIVEP